MAMVIYKCDLCGEVKECSPKKIDGKYYDICQTCFGPLEEKLKGKQASAGRSVLLDLEGIFDIAPLKELFQELKRKARSV
jgi:hypothetical protein